jgi:tetratricopeptide (TPR) repeat protein
MKCAWIKYFPFFVAIILFTACGGNKPAATYTDTDPILEENPNLRPITDEIKKSPGDPLLYYQRGRTLQKMRLDSLALSDYKKAVSLDSNRAEYYSAIGDLLFEAKDLNGALEWIQKAIAKKPDDRQAHLKIAKLFLYLQDYPRAFEEINIVLRKNVYDPEAYFLKGMIYKDAKDTAKAISNFLTAVQVQPDHRDAVIQLGLLYGAKGDSIAMRYLDNAYAMDTTDVFPLYARGTFFQQMGNVARAKAEYRRAIIKNRNFTEALFNMGYLLMQEDSIEKAWRQYDMVIKTEPGYPAAYYNRGLCAEMMDSIANAIRDYRTAYRLDTSFEKPKLALKRLKAL